MVATTTPVESAVSSDGETVRRHGCPPPWVIAGIVALLLSAVPLIAIWLPLKAASKCQGVLDAAKAAGGTVDVVNVWYENPYIGFWPSEVRLGVKRYLPEGMQCLDRWQMQSFVFNHTAAIDDDWLFQHDFAALPCEVYIRICHPRVGDVGIGSLAGVTRLETLLVPQTSLTDGGLKAFAGHPHLVRLSLHETGVTAASLPVLASMPKLAVLVVSSTGIPGDELHQLRACPELARLVVDAGQLTESFLSSLSTFPSLDSLLVVGPTARPIAPLPGTRVDAQTDAVMDDDLLERILKETTITYLWVEDGSAITDAGVPPLLKASHIHKLDAWNVNMSSQGAHQVNSVLRSWDGRSPAVRLPGESTVYRDSFANEYK